MRGVTLPNEPEVMWRWMVIAAPVGLSLILFYLSIIVPPAGMLAPAPLYYSLVTNGNRTGLALTALAMVVVLLTGGTGAAMLYLLFCGLIAWPLALAWKRRASLGVAIGVPALVPYVLGALVLAGLGAHVDETIHGAVSETLQQEATALSGDGMDMRLADWLKENSGQVAEIMTRLFYGIVLASFLFSVSMNYLLIRIFSIRLGLGIHFSWHDFAGWRSSDSLVWVVIVGGFTALAANGMAQTIAWNILLVSALVYLLQGLAVVHDFFSKRKFPTFVKGLGYFLIFAQPFALIIVCVLGFADVWADFRKIESRE